METEDREPAAASAAAVSTVICDDGEKCSFRQQIILKGALNILVNSLRKLQLNQP